MKVARLLLVLIVVALAVTGFITWQASRHSQTALLVEQIQSDLVREIDASAREARLVQSYLSAGISPWYPAESPFLFYKFKDGVLTGWSDHHMIPTDADTARVRYFRSGQSDYLLCRYALDNREVLLVAIPLIRKFSVTNQYLHPWWNPKIFPHEGFQLVDPLSQTGSLVTYEGKALFRLVDPLEGQHFAESQQIILVIAYAAIMLAISGMLYLVACRWRRKELGFLVLLGVGLGIRWLLTTYHWPATYFTLRFFDPQVYASSTLNGSPGDLLLNVAGLIFPAAFLLQWYRRFRLVRWRKGWISLVLVFLLLHVFSLPFRVVQSIYHNSSLNLDVAHLLPAEPLMLPFLLALMLAGAVAFMAGHVLVRLCSGIFTYGKGMIGFVLGLGAYILNCEYSDQPYLFIVLTALAFWGIALLLKLERNLRLGEFGLFSYILLFVFFQALLVTVAIDNFSTERKINNLFRYATNYLDRDYFGEYLLHEAGQNVAADKFIQSTLITPFLNREAIKQKIRQIYLPRYFDKYETVIRIFNSTGAPLSGADAGFTHLLESYNTQAAATSYNDVFFVDSPQGDYTRKYLLIVPVKWKLGVAGFIMVDMTLKRIVPDVVYPELLVDNRFRQSSDEDFSYVVLGQGRVLSSAGQINYEPIVTPHWLGNPELYTTGIRDKTSWHVGVEDLNNRVSIVSSSRTPIQVFLGTFSFYFVLGLFFILLLVGVRSAQRYRTGKRLSLADRIQVILNLAFFLPLIVVSSIVLSVTHSSSNRRLQDEFELRATNFALELSELLRSSPDSTSVYVGSVSTALTDFARLTQLDVNLYDRTGQLMATTQPLIFEGNLFSRQINDLALQQIQRNTGSFVVDETVGSLQFSTAYASLRNPTSGEAMGIVALPFFRSAASLQRQQSDILTSILINFVLVFLILLLLAFAISHWLTAPLKVITQSLRKISLTQMNSPLDWRSDDELGLFAKEYNQLVYKLRESLAALERTQREQAWREIAQQVAHEIKNPLTPMKLTLQQMERSLESSEPDGKSLRAVKSVLSQVEVLNDIATSFSTFAKLPEPVLRPVAIDTLVHNVVALHQHQGNVTIVQGSGPWKAWADEALLTRIISNLLLNAFQAEIPGQSLEVNVHYECQGDRLRIAVEDNGKGMTPEVAERIFLPHFTTKKTGSGLGLAISKQAIEQMKGSLSFTTNPMRGTRFVVELPAVSRTEDPE